MTKPSAKRRFLKRLGKHVFRGTDTWFGWASRVPDEPILRHEHIPWLADLERAAPAIRGELDALLRRREHLPRFQDIVANQHRIAPDDRWRIFALWGFGRCSELGRTTCPETAACLDRIPGLESAMFSILAPGKHIPRHRGVTRALLRCHLGLVVPRSGTCEMDVDGRRVRWREGEAFVFDDSRPHEVWNDTDEERVVLLLDVRRPMRWPGRWLYAVLSAALRRTHFVRESVDAQLAWERAIADRFRPTAVTSRPSVRRSLEGAR
jgi:beta-hydroxylase